MPGSGFTQREQAALPASQPSVGSAVSWKPINCRSNWRENFQSSFDRFKRYKSTADLLVELYRCQRLTLATA
uniref:Transposase n=1 Tax=Macrostomum lignano TaxID=282301 RepID=A0A1I8FMM5_9PLAT